VWCGHPTDSMGDLTPEQELRQLRLENQLMARAAKEYRRELLMAKREEHARLAGWARHASNLNARVEHGLRALDTKEALLQAAKKTNEEVRHVPPASGGSNRAATRSWVPTHLCGRRGFYGKLNEGPHVRGCSGQRT